MSNTFTPAVVLDYLQTETQALQQVLKAFKKQQEALIAGDADGVLSASQSAEAALLALSGAQSAEPAALLADSLADPSELQREFEQQAPTQLRRLQLLLDMRYKLLQSLSLCRQENEALIQQAQQLNEAQLQHLVALHQNTQPVVYGAQGDNAPEFQAARSAYDFSA